MTPELTDQLYAHHAALLAIPAFVPAVVVVGVVLYIARKDRLAEAEENAAREDGPDSEENES